MAIADDFAIDYVNKILSYTGTGAGFTNGIPDTKHTTQALYDYIMDTFDEPAQMDNLPAMDAATPTAFSMANRWFIDDTSIKALFGGALDTTDWTFNATADRDGHFGITRLNYSGDGAPTEGGDGYTDKGVTLTGGTSGATATILYADQANTTIWVRNTSSTQFTAGGEAITGTGWNIDTDATTGTASGEQLWTNVFTLGTFADDTDVYIVQNDVKLTSWWADGQIDELIKVRENGTLIDSGLVYVMARQYGVTYDFFQPDLSVGSRQPAPLATAADLNNTTGYRNITTGVFTGGPFTEGEVITGGTSGAKGILTAQVADTSLTYYLVGKDLTVFQSGEVITGELSSATATSSAGPTNVGPATWSDVTIAFGAITRDLNNGAGLRKYSIEIDCNTRVLSQVYERLKYLTRRGSTTQLGPAGSFQQDGEQYIGNVVRLNVTETTAWVEGLLLTQNGGTGAGSTGVIVAYHDDGGTGQLILSQVRGTFTDDETTVTDSGTGTGTIDSGGVVTIVPVKANPFGNFAGGTFFGAPGVFVTDVNAADIQAYQLIDDLGVNQNPPNEVAIAITDLEADDRGAVFRLAGASQPIDRDRYLGTVQSAGAVTVVVGTGITSDEPAAGVVKIADVSDAERPEARLRYTSWATSTFTLATAVSGTATAGSTGSTLIDSTADFGGTEDIRIGDTIRNISTGAWGYVISIDSTTQLTSVSAPGQTLTWANTNTYDSNTLPFATTTSDEVYVPLLDDRRATAGDLSNTLIYSADIPVTVRVRQSGIKPFIQDTTVNSGGLSVAAVRIPDTVVTP